MLENLAAHLCEESKLPEHARGHDVHERDVRLQHNGCHEHVAHVAVARDERAGGFPAVHDMLSDCFMLMVDVMSMSHMSLLREISVPAAFLLVHDMLSDCFMLLVDVMSTSRMSRSREISVPAAFLLCTTHSATVPCCWWTA